MFGKGKEKKPLEKLPNPISSVNTAEKLASIANVSEKTYRMGAKILNSDNEKLKQEVLSGKKSINAETKSFGEKKHLLLTTTCLKRGYIQDFRNDLALLYAK